MKEEETVSAFKHATAQNVRFRSYEMSQGGKEFLPKTRMFLEKEYQEKMQKQSVIVELQQQVDNLERKLSIITVQNEHLNEEISSVSKRVRQRDQQNEVLRSNYYELLHEHDLVKMQQRTQSAYLIQNQHLRHDNHKLVDMLRSTDEFKDWAERADDAVGSLRFLKNLQSHELLSQKGYVHYCACNPKAVIDNEKWVPQSAYKAAVQLMEKNNWTLNEKLLEQLFYNISKFYSQRQRNLISHIKKQNLAELQQLKRKVNYQEKVVEKTDLARLRRTMDKLVRENVNLTYKQRLPFQEQRILRTSAKAANSLSKMQKQLKKAKELGKEERRQSLRNGMVQTVYL